jgi:RimJ/RimL family protein N-acetyltransferase
MNNYPNETFETESLFFRRITVADAESEFEMFGDPEYTWFLGRTFSLEHIQKGIQKEIDKRIFINGLGKWAIISKENNETAGSCAVVKVKNRDEIEISYFLKKRYWGRGIGTIAAGIMLRYGFEILKLPQIIIRVHKQNLKSINIALKLKMKFIGFIEYPDEDVSLNVYSMSLEEYTELYAVNKYV